MPTAGSQSAPPRRRRTQEERSASTRARLLDATIECLVDLGYPATTTTVIADRAGISRGAQLHHYPTKASLVAAAVEHLARRLGQELTGQAARFPEGSERVAAAIDVLWAGHATPLFHAWLELWVAARTDAELRAALVPVQRRLAAAVDRQARLLFGDDATAHPRYEEVVDLTFSLLQGMALQRALSGEGKAARRRREAATLAAWKTMVAAALGGRGAQAGEAAQAAAGRR